MFQTVIAMQGENSQTIFTGLAVAGGVLGAFLPPIGRISRLPYFGLLVLSYVLIFGSSYVIGSSTIIPLIFWGYLIIGVLGGIVTAWIARARSADITGDGSYAFLAFIPLAGLYLVFASGKFTGSTITQSRTTTTIVGLAIAGMLAVFGTYGMIDSASKDSPIVFAKEVAAQVVPSRLDDVTLQLEAEAVGNRVKLFHMIEGRTEAVSDATLQNIKSNICANKEINKLFEQAGVEREFIYLDENRNLLGSFVAGCP